MSRTRTAALLCATLLIAGACAPRVDVASETRALLDTDRAWAHQAATGHDADSVLAYWTDDATVAIPGAALLQGKDAIRKMVTSARATPGFQVTWTPQKAVVAQSGDLGYTVGRIEFAIPDSAGHVTTTAGNYLTVWRKGADGRWQCAEDYTTPAPGA